MTIKEAILIALEGLGKPASHQEVTQYIYTNHLYEFSGLTPDATVSAQLGEFLRKNDTRVGRQKANRGYLYFLTKNERLIDISEDDQEFFNKRNAKVQYLERDLHPLFASYLKSKDIYACTILHESSKNSKDDTQKWIHPDMIGVKFKHFTSEVSTRLLKTLEKQDACEIFSYELKKEINTDYELKKCYFQAVSNSSWANKGYLVAFEINTSLYSEIERLNKAFGIGVIELAVNPFESRVLFPAVPKRLDFQTIDKLCNINDKYNSFMEQIEKTLDANSRYFNSSLSELSGKSDSFMERDEEIEVYCKEKNIPSDFDKPSSD